MTLNLLFNSTLEKVRASSNYLYRNSAANAISSSSSVGEEIQVLRRGIVQPCFQEKKEGGGVVVRVAGRGSFLSKPWSSLSLCYRSLHLGTGCLDHKPKEAPRSAGSNGSHKSQPGRQLETRRPRPEKQKFIDMKNKGPGYTRTKIYDNPSDRGLASSIANFQNPLKSLGFQNTYKKFNKKCTPTKKVSSRMIGETSKTMKNHRLPQRQFQKHSSTIIEGKENMMVSSDKILNMRPLYWQKTSMNNSNGGNLEKKTETLMMPTNSNHPNKSTSKQSNGRYPMKKESPLKASRNMSKMNLTKENKNNLYQSRLEVSSNGNSKTKEKVSPLNQTRKSSYATNQTRTDNSCTPSQIRNESSYTPNGKLSAENVNGNRSNKSMLSNIFAEKIAQLNQARKDGTAKPNGNSSSQILTEEQGVLGISQKRGGGVSGKKIWPPLYEKKESAPVPNVPTSTVKTPKEKKIDVSELKQKIQTGASASHSTNVPEITKENDSTKTPSALEDDLKSVKSLAGNEVTNNNRTSDKEDKNGKNKISDNNQNFEKTDVSKKIKNELATKWPPIYARVKTPDKSKPNESIVKYNSISSEHPKRKKIKKLSPDSQKTWPPLYAKRKQSDTLSQKSSSPFDQFNSKIKLYTKSIENPVSEWKPRRQVISARNSRIRSKADVANQEPSVKSNIVASPSKTGRTPSLINIPSKTDLQHIILMRKKRKKYQLADIYNKHLLVANSKGNIRRSLSSFLASKKKHLTLVLKEEINKWKRVEDVTREINLSKSNILRAITHNTEMKDQYKFSEPIIICKTKNNSNERIKEEVEKSVTRSNSVTLVPLTKSCFYVKGKKSPVTSRKGRSVLTYNKNSKKPALLTELEKSKKQISSDESETGHLSFCKVVDDTTKILNSSYRKKLLRQIPPPGNDTGIRHTYMKPQKLGSPKTPSKDKVIKDEDVPEAIRGLTKFSALTKEKTDDLNSLSNLADEILLPLKRLERKHGRTTLSSAGSKSMNGSQQEQKQSSTKQFALPSSKLKTAQSSTTNVSYYPSSYSIQPNLIVQVIPTQNKIMLLESRDGNLHTKEHVPHTGGKGGSGGGGLGKSVCIGSSKDVPIQNKYSVDRSSRKKDIANFGKVVASLDQHHQKFISIPSIFNKEHCRQPLTEIGNAVKLSLDDIENDVATNDNASRNKSPVKQLACSSEELCPPDLKVACQSGLMLVEECRTKDFESPLDSEFIIKYDFDEDLALRTARSGPGSLKNGFVLVNSGEDNQKEKKKRPRTPAPYALSDPEMSDKLDRHKLPKVPPTIKLPSPEEEKEKSSEEDPLTESPKNDMIDSRFDSEKRGFLGQSPILNLCRSDLKTGNVMKSKYERPKDGETLLSFPPKKNIPAHHHPESWITRNNFFPASCDFKKDPVQQNKDVVAEPNSNRIPSPFSLNLSQNTGNALHANQKSTKKNWTIEGLSGKSNKPYEALHNLDIISDCLIKEHKNVANQIEPQIVKQGTLSGEKSRSVAVNNEHVVLGSKSRQKKLTEINPDSLTSKIAAIKNKENIIVSNVDELGNIDNTIERQLDCKNVRIEGMKNEPNIVIPNIIGIDNEAHLASKNEKSLGEERETISSSDSETEKMKNNSFEFPQTEVVCNEDQAHNGTFEECIESLKQKRTNDLSNSIPRSLDEDLSSRENLIKYYKNGMCSEELKKSLLEDDDRKFNQFDNQRYFLHEKQNKTYYKDYKSNSNEFSGNIRTSLGLEAKDSSADGVFQKLVNFCKTFSPFKGPGIHQSSPDLRSEFNAVKRRHYSPFDGIEVLQPLNKMQAINGKEIILNCKRYRALDVVDKLAKSEKDNVMLDEEIYHEEAPKTVSNNYIFNKDSSHLDENKNMAKKREQEISWAAVNFSPTLPSKKGLNRNMFTNDTSVSANSWNSVKDHLKQKYCAKKKIESKTELDKIDGGISAKKVLSAMRVRSQIRKIQKPKKNVKSTTYLDIPVGKLMKSLSDQVSFTSKQPIPVGSAKGSMSKPIIKQKPTFMKDNGPHKICNTQPKPVISKKPQKMKNIFNKLSKSINEIPEEFVLTFNSVPSRVVEPIHVLDRTFQSTVLTSEIKQTIFPFYNPESYWQDSTLVKDNTVFSNSTPSLNNIYLNYIKRERLTN